MVVAAFATDRQGALAGVDDRTRPGIARRVDVGPGSIM
jgi:hypothetical protein